MASTLWLIVLAGALSIVYGIVTTRGLLAADAGSARMQEISAAVREGAAAYLNKKQYTTIAVVGRVILAVLIVGIFLGSQRRRPGSSSARCFRGWPLVHRHERIGARQRARRHRLQRSHSRVVWISPSSQARLPACSSQALAFSA